MASTILTALSEGSLLALLRRTTPPEYHEPLEATANSGWEIHEAHAQQMARVSSGLVQLELDQLIDEAEGPAYATGEVSFSRPDASAGAVTLARGTEVLTTEGLAYLTGADAVFGAAAVGPVTVAATARTTGYGTNVRAGTVTTIGKASASSTGSDDTIAVTNAAAFSGGRPDALQALGRERNVLRLRGEEDEDYRIRIRTLPDVVSTSAIQRMCDLYGARYGVQIDVIKPWDNPVYCDDGYCDADEDAWAYSRVTQRGAFTVWVPDIGAVNDTAAYCDTDYCDDAYTDGGDAAKAAVGIGLLEALDRIKGGAIAIRLIQLGLGAEYPFSRDNFTDDIAAGA